MTGARCLAAPDEITAEALRWVGTPYQHRAAVKGSGCDCLGLVLGVRAALGHGAAPTLPIYAKRWAVPGGDELLWRGLSEALRPFESGPVVLLRLKRDLPAQHLGLLTGDGRMVHAWAGRGVVVGRYRPWAARAVAFFDF